MFIFVDLSMNMIAQSGEFLIRLEQAAVSAADINRGLQSICSRWAVHQA
jgi:hypothetical protein